MSDIQNQNPEQAMENLTIEGTPSDTNETSSEAQQIQPQTEGAHKGGKNNNPSRSRNSENSIREEEKEFSEEMLSVDRVTRVTAGGRQIRFRASVVIGDRKGRIGLGTGKSGEVQGAIEKAIRDAKKNLISFPIVNGTIPHDVAVTYKSSGLYIHPAHPGTGIIAGGAVRKIFAVSGVKDVIAKQHGAPNRITNARVAIKALKALKPVHLVTSFSARNSSTSTSEKEEKETLEISSKKVSSEKKFGTKKSSSSKKINKK